MTVTISYPTSEELARVAGLAGIMATAIARQRADSQSAMPVVIDDNREFSTDEDGNFVLIENDTLVAVAAKTLLQMVDSEKELLSPPRLVETYVSLNSRDEITITSTTDATNLGDADVVLLTHLTVYGHRLVSDKKYIEIARNVEMFYSNAAPGVRIQEEAIVNLGA